MQTLLAAMTKAEMEQRLNQLITIIQKQQDVKDKIFEKIVEKRSVEIMGEFLNTYE